jgi:uncharacterized repeat protein (TIGR02543 family)
MSKYKFDIQLFAGSSITTSTVFPASDQVRIYFNPSDVEDHLEDSTASYIYIARTTDVGYLVTKTFDDDYDDNHRLRINGNQVVLKHELGGFIWYSTYETDGYYDIDMSSWTLAERTVASVDTTYLSNMGITWEDMNASSTWTVTYDSNGGSAVTAEEDIEDGGYAEEPSDPTRSNYTFAGWFTDDDTFADEWDFTIDTVTEDITLYAKWTQSSFTVTYDSNGGSAVTAEEDIEDGGYAEEPSDPTRSNYTFAGWFTDDDTFANEWDFTTDTVTEDITLYAKWTQSVENKFTQWGRAVHTLIKAPTSEQKNTDHTLELTDAGKVILATNAIKITIPLNSAVAFPINTEIAVVRYSAGTVTIGTSSGATLNGESSTTTFDLGDQYTSVAIKKVGTDTWIMVGAFEESE